MLVNVLKFFASEIFKSSSFCKGKTVVSSQDCVNIAFSKRNMHGYVRCEQIMENHFCDDRADGVELSIHSGLSRQQGNISSYWVQSLSWQF